MFTLNQTSKFKPKKGIKYLLSQTQIMDDQSSMQHVFNDNLSEEG